MKNTKHSSKVIYKQSYNFNRFITPITFSVAFSIVYYNTNYALMHSMINIILPSVLLLYVVKILLLFKRSTTITSKRILVRKGVFKKVKSIYINDIIDVSLSQNTFEKIFNYGDIYIEYKYPGCFFTIKGVNTPSIVVSQIEYLFELSKQNTRINKIKDTYASMKQDAKNTLSKDLKQIMNETIKRN